MLALLVGVGAGACTDGVSPDGSGEGIAVALSLQGPVAVSQAEIDALASAFGRVDAYEVIVTDSLNGSTVLATTLPVVSTGPSTHSLGLTLPGATIGLSVRVTVIGRDGAVELYRTSGYARVEASATPAPVILFLRYTGPGIRGTVSDEAGAPVAGLAVQLRQGQTTISTATTEPDGTYLFLPTSEGGPLGVGLYQVQPVPPPQQFVCPGSRTTSVTANSALVANFTATTLGCAIDLLIVSGGDVDDTQAVAALFANTPNVTTQTFFFVNQTPGLGFLSQFDAVLLFANGQFAESATLGSEIESYVQAGGNLVIGSFYWQNRSDSNLGSSGWGALEAIDPFASLIDPVTGVGGATYQAGSLGLVVRGDAATGDALVQGLNTLTSTGFRGGVSAQTGTTVVARWDDGTPLIGYRILPGGQRLVAISLFPASGQAAGGDTGALWDNAVTWTGAAGGPSQGTPTTPPAFDSNQPSGSTQWNAQTSQRITAPTPWAQTFDDFTLTDARTITRVQWQGIYCEQTIRVLAPEPTATSFFVAFYADANNAPDTSNPLASGTYAMGRVTETFVSTNTTGVCGTAQPTAIPLYAYTLTLNAPFVAAAGVRYWFSVQAITPDFGIFWGWRNGTASNNRSIQITDTGATNVFTTDRAFSLLGP